ncbi:DUF4244 domain-containing protein [Paeniglutamicibacter cryotolerans]|uniref:DUF4244 domain-containing protein n=1 Tax=Paeniglutamicibacter cryotolerans TaxID=670079 RepID=A0A839QF38_9MICC|nr:DUF4244 domain-containing protein [Paeniglutamicibacter cryotolerans]MBB2994233.1 hypothetical protein [Paeniglutamicibacter cryotolerans]
MEEMNGTDAGGTTADSGIAETGVRAGLRAQSGIATAEFAIVTLAAVGFAGLLVGILSSGTVRALLMGLVRQALNY